MDDEVQEIIDECIEEWDWTEHIPERQVDDIQDEIELAARQVMEMAVSDEAPEQILPNIAGKLNRIETIANGRVDW
jgi:hypothetical protein